MALKVPAVGVVVVVVVVVVELLRARWAVGDVEGGVEAVVLVASWEVPGWALAEDGMLRSPGRRWVRKRSGG